MKSCGGIIRTALPGCWSRTTILRACSPTRRRWRFTWSPWSRRRESLQLQQVPFPADVSRRGFADLHGLPFGLVDVAAKKMRRLNSLDEFAHGAAARMKAVVDPVERGVQGRRMANHNQRLQIRELI